MEKHPFEPVIQDYIEQGARSTQGKIIHEEDNFQNLQIMDAGFECTKIIVKAIQDHLAELGFNVKKVLIYTAFESELEGYRSKMETEHRLSVVRNDDGTHTAVFFAGCTLEKS